MDFMSDALASGHKLRVLTVLDTCTRECVALEVATGFGGQQVADVLTRVGLARGRPTTITVDHGTEFTSRALDHWAYRNRVKLDDIRPGRPTENGFIERFNAAVRRECLSQHYSQRFRTPRGRGGRAPQGRPGFDAGPWTGHEPRA